MVTPINRLLSIYLLMLIGVLSVVGCSQSKTSSEYLSQARQDHQKGNDQAALIDLKNALKKDSKNGEARLLLAQILIKRGEGSAAEIELHKAIDLGISKSYVAVPMGQALLLQRKYQKVVDTIKVADADKGKVAAGIYSVRGDAYLALAKIDEAQTAYEEALKNDPAYADAYLGLGKLAAVRDDLNEAIRQTEIALSKEPKSLKAWLMKARLLLVQSKDDDARQAYEHVLQIDSRNVSAHLGLVSVALGADQLDKASAEVEAANKIAPKALAVQYAKAVVDFRRAEYKHAMEAIQAVLKAAPDNLSSILLSGAIAFAQGSYELANSQLSQVVAQDPSDAYARRLLATTQIKLGESAKVLKTLQPLLTPELADGKALALAGEAALKARNYGKAAEYLQRAIELNPQAKQLPTQLAISRLGLGKTDEAIKDLEAVAKDTPGQSPADILLIITYLQHKEYDQALAAIASLEKKLGSNPLTHNLRGVVLMRKHDLAGARKAFEQALVIQPSYFTAAANLARLDIQDNKPEEARKRFEAILDKDKKNAQAMMALAELAASQNRGQEYVNWLQKAAKADPKAVPPRAGLVKYYLAKKDDTKALTLARDAVSANPDFPEALNLLGNTQLATGDMDGAVATFASLVKSVPGSPDAYLHMALAQMAVKRNAEARVNLNKALQIKPDHLPSLDALLKLDLKDKGADVALKLAQRMVRLHPESPVGYDREGNVLVSLKRLPEAIKAYQQALDRGAPTTTLIKLLGAMTGSGDPKGAERHLVAWIDQHPNDIDARSYAARLYMLSGRNKEAIAQYEALERIDARDVAAINNLAILYQRVKDGRALTAADKALKLAPNNAAVLDTAGWIHVQQGDLPQGLKLLEKAVATAPQNATMHYHYAVALARVGKKDDAKKELEAAINGGRAFPELEDAKSLLKNL